MPRVRRTSQKWEGPPACCSPAAHLRRTSSGLRVCPSSNARVATSRKNMLPLSVPRAAVLPAASRTTVTRVRLAGKLQERGGESKARHLPAGEGRAGWTHSMGSLRPLCTHRACSQHTLTPWKGFVQCNQPSQLSPSMPAKKGIKISSPGLRGLTAHSLPCFPQAESEHYPTQGP